MPMSRYEIRNEYSLADPELYRAADKDDPEALLEGVAMAGLVGVLRQLGDLAEFAAEIFHNLHEEVMTTAARGHSLMVRVQQLEAELPSIERAFLSQTDHSSFFYQPGVDWNPNLRIEQNLVTQGDLPRFIMDSYEECRAPPRLFLLDKFDVAGAGACLKRYTDPSFFKVEISGMSNSDVQREKKILRPKKRVPRWRNGETNNCIPASHTKLHQLFLEEQVQNGTSNPVRRVRLKRRLNGFPFDSKTGRSYMEKLLESPSPDHKLVHEVNVNSLSPQMFGRRDENKSGLEVHEVRSVRSDGDGILRQKDPPLSPGRGEIVLNPSIYESSEVSTDDKTSVLFNSYHGFAADGISRTRDKENGEKVISVDVERNREGILTGYESDCIVSDVENYVDAPLAVDSEMDSEPEMRVKNGVPHRKSQLVASANEELHSRSSDSHLTGYSTMSDEENNSSRKEISIFYSSDSPSSSAEMPQQEKYSKGLPADISEIEIDDASSYQINADNGFLVDQHRQPLTGDDVCTLTHAANDPSSEFEPASDLIQSGSRPTFMHSDAEVVTKNMLMLPDSDEVSSTLNDCGKETNRILNDPCYSDVSDFELQKGDDPVRSSDIPDFELQKGDDPIGPADGHLVGEQTGQRVSCLSTVLDVNYPATDSLITTLVEETDKEDQNLVANVNSSSELMSTENPISDKLDNEFSEIPQNISSCPDITYSVDNIKPMVPQEENLLKDLNNEDSVVSFAGSNSFSGTAETFQGNKLDVVSSANVQTAEAEENCSNTSTENQFSSENLILSHLANSSDCMGAGLDADEKTIPDPWVAAKEKIALESQRSHEVVALQGTGVADYAFLNDLEDLENTCHKLENFEASAQASDHLEINGINLFTSSTNREVSEISVSDNPRSPNNIQLDKSSSEGGEFIIADAAPIVLAVLENSTEANIPSNVGLEESVDQHMHSFEVSGWDERVDDKAYLTGSEVGQLSGEGLTRVATSDSEAALHNSTNNDNPKSEISDIIPNPHLDLEVDDSLGFVSQPLLNRRGINTECQSGLQNPDPTDETLSVAPDTEESKVEHIAELPLSQLGVELLHSSHVDERGRNAESEVLRQSDLQNHAPINETLPVDSDAQGSKETEGTGLPSNQLDQELYQSSAGQKGRDADSVIASVIDCHTEKSKLQENIGLPTCQLDQELGHSDEMNLRLSPLLPLNHQQMLAHDNHIVESNSSLTVSLAGHSNSPPVSSLLRLNNFAIDVSGYPKGPSGFMFSLSNPFSEATQRNLSDSPPLPPLPPVQWRTGKIQQSLSLTEGEMMKHRELFPQFISPLIASIDGVSSSLTASADDTSSCLLKAPADDINSSQQLSSSLIVPADGVSFSSLTAPVDDDSSSLLTVSSGANNSSQQLISPLVELIDGASSSPTVAPTDNENLMPEMMKHAPIQTATGTKSEDEKVENSSTASASLKDMDKDETANLLQKIESQLQLQLVTPAPDGESMMSTVEDADGHEIRPVKLPRPRNPLVEDVSVLDKSKLRKVSERIAPQVQKVDGRSSLLEQIRTKSFNLKPAMASRPKFPGAKTNLNVTAILEKANAIRQACAGSDEDDDDSWSE